MFSQIHYEFDHEFTIKFLIWLWIHYLFCDLTMNSRLFALSTFFSFLKYLWTHYQFRDLTMIYLSFERNNYEFTIFLANLFWNYYVSREFTMNSSSVREFTMISIFVSWFDYKFIFFSQTHSQFSFFPEFIIFLANSQWIHYFFAISLWSSIYFAFCVWIHYQFLDLTINALFVRFITMD